MNRIQILPLGVLPGGRLAELCAGIEKVFRCGVEILPPENPPERAFNVSRQQYSSTEILASLAARALPQSRLLAVTPSDLYVPVLTFVFGEAQLDGPCAVVSTCRLGQEFYGLPADERLLKERLLKEAVHELGHTWKLMHCQDYQCVMAPSHAVEWIDLKSHQFCPECWAAFQSKLALVNA